MIKISATVCGTIVRDAVIVTNDKSISHIEFSLNVVIPSKTNDGLQVQIPVTVNCSNREELHNYILGNRIVMKGSLVISKSADNLVFKLTDAKPEITYSVPAHDFVTGDMEFAGKAKDIKEKTDKRGLPYVRFTAYSPVKVSKDRWEYVRLQFWRFPAKAQTYYDVKPEWLAEGTSVNILGDMQLTSYNGYMNITCRISMIEPRNQDEDIPSDAVNNSEADLFPTEE